MAWHFYHVIILIVLLPFYPPGAYTGVGRGLYLLQQQQESSAKVVFLIQHIKINNNNHIVDLFYLRLFIKLIQISSDLSIYF